jgi:hypothetical protein
LRIAKIARIAKNRRNFGNLAPERRLLVTDDVSKRLKLTPKNNKHEDGAKVTLENKENIYHGGTEARRKARDRVIGIGYLVVSVCFGWAGVHP